MQEGKGEKEGGRERGEGEGERATQIRKTEQNET